MNIFQLIGELKDGGAETLVKDYAIQLTKDGHDVTVVVWESPKDTANYQRLKEAGIKIISVYNSCNLSEKWQKRLMGNNRYMAFSLTKIIKKEKPDVLHIHLENLKIVSEIWKNIGNVKLFYTCHSLPQIKIGEGNLSEHLAAKFLLKEANLQIIALHEKMAEEINRMFGIKTTVVIKNSVDISRFEQIKESQKSIRKKIEIPEDAFVIGHVGRFTEAKNHEFLIQIFRRVHEIKRHAYLLCIGTGDKLPDIIRSLEQYNLMKFTRIFSNVRDTEEMYRAMDVFCFPSKWEGLGLAVIEAQASGLRCFVSDQVPSATAVTDQVSCLPLGSVDKWTDAILYGAPVQHPEGKLSDYDVKSTVSKLEELYTS